MGDWNHPVRDGGGETSARTASGLRAHDGDCTSPECGDGFHNDQHVIRAGEDDEMYAEECDDGDDNENNDCLGSCKEARCGDGVLHNMATGTEECDVDEDDDGIADNAINCDSDCTLPICGDSHPNQTAGEFCDSGGVDSLTCDFDCTSVQCGDGHFNSVAEACDDRGVDTSTCDSDCTPVECGDGHFNPAAKQCGELDGPDCMVGNLPELSR